MKDENALVQTVNRFMFRTTVVLAVFFVLSGIDTVSRRAKETRGETSFSSAAFVDNEREIGLKIGERFLTVDKQTVKEIEAYIKKVRTLMARYG